MSVTDLARLHAEMRGRDQILVVELHTHPPGAGGQNEVDAAHPAATYDGFLSIVVPDFALPYLHDLRKCHVYADGAGGEWTELAPDQIGRMFTIEENLVMVPGR